MKTLLIKPSKATLKRLDLFINDEQTDIISNKDNNLSLSLIAKVYADLEKQYASRKIKPFFELRKTILTFLESKKSKLTPNYVMSILFLFRNNYIFSNMTAKRRLKYKDDAIASIANKNTEIYEVDGKLITAERYKTLKINDEQNQKVEELYKKLNGGTIEELFNLFPTGDFSSVSGINRALSLNERHVSILLTKLYVDEDNSIQKVYRDIIKKSDELLFTEETKISKQRKIANLQRKINSARAELLNLQNELTAVMLEQ